MNLLYLFKIIKLIRDIFIGIRNTVYVHFLKCRQLKYIHYTSKYIQKFLFGEPHTVGYIA